MRARTLNLSTPTSIGLRASFDGKQLKLSIVGLPLLEENERISMRSEKIRELEPPAPVYEENPELAYGEEKIVEQAQPGSVWKSYRIRTKNGPSFTPAPIKQNPLRYSAIQPPCRHHRSFPIQTGEKTSRKGRQKKLPQKGRS